MAGMFFTGPSFFGFARFGLGQVGGMLGWRGRGWPKRRIAEFFGSDHGNLRSSWYFTQRTGWVDLSHGLRARQLPDGRYCPPQERNFHGKVLVILWTPSV